MSIVKVTLPVGELPVNGKQVSFVAPCDCTQTEAIQIDGENYTVVDALCNCVTGKGGRWVTGAIVSVILDVDNKYAYIQNDNSQPANNVVVSASWTADSTNGGYYNTVTVNGINAADTYVSDLVLGSDKDANKLYIEAWALVTRIVTGVNSVTFYADEDAPEIAFNVQLKAVK